MNPILDILNGQQLIRSQGYDTSGGVMGMNSIEHKYLMSYLINVKGSSIPGFSSEAVKTGIVTNILGCRVVVSENATTDYAFMFIPQTALKWKNFKGMTSYTIDNPGIGKKYRIIEEGVALLVNPKSVHVITDTVE